MVLSWRPWPEVGRHGVLPSLSLSSLPLYTQRIQWQISLSLYSCKLFFFSLSLCRNKAFFFFSLVVPTYYFLSFSFLSSDPLSICRSLVFHFITVWRRRRRRRRKDRKKEGEKHTFLCLQTTYFRKKTISVSNSKNIYKVGCMFSSFQLHSGGITFNIVFYFERFRVFIWYIVDAWKMASMQRSRIYVFFRRESHHPYCFGIPLRNLGYHSCGNIIILSV